MESTSATFQGNPVAVWTKDSLTDMMWLTFKKFGGIQGETANSLCSITDVYCRKKRKREMLFRNQAIYLSNSALYVTGGTGSLV